MAGLRDQHCMFPLRRQAMVAGDHGPVVRQQLNLFFAGIDHGLDGEGHAGKKEVKLLPDNWTVVTRDHSLSAQWDHTVLVTDTDHEILTIVPGDDP